MNHSRKLTLSCLPLNFYVLCSRKISLRVTYVDVGQVKKVRSKNWDMWILKYLEIKGKINQNVDNK